MLSRFIATHSRHLRHLSLSLSPHFHPSSTPTFPAPRIPNCHSSSFVRLFSSNQDGSNNNGEKPTSDLWKIGSEKSDLDDVFGTHDGDLTESNAKVEKESKVSQEQSWVIAKNENGGDESLFDEFGDQKSVRAGDGWSPMADFQPWKLGAEEKIGDLFGIEVLSGEGKRLEDSGEGIEEEDEMVKAAKKLELEKEEQALMEVLNGPNRAFGDLVAVSGITDAMLDSLIALKNFQDIDGLPPLEQIEDERYAKTQRKSSRYEMELQKQEEAAKARVRQVDEKGRAYGTGRRKCSIARVWIQPGEGKFSINEKEFDVYFPMLDHRAALLRPFSETKTLGLWDVKCTVKGGGVSGQVGAIRLGISRALQCWEPGLRPPLRDAGFLTRDPRVVERKKPGKAKARKSFQWVKR